MRDKRKEIISLEEQSLYAFIEERIRILQIGDTWRTNLPAFVNNQYKSYPQNIKGLYNFLKANPVSDLNIKSLDVTSIMALLLYYNDFKALYDANSFNNDSDIYYCYKNLFYDLLNARNNIKHYSETITDNEKNDFVIDQIDALCSIIRFSLLCEKHCPKGEFWKEIIRQALSLQDIIRCEKWFVLQAEMKNLVNPNDDYSDIEMSAESGNESAQVILGKIIYNGDGNKFVIDPDKSFYWFFKAAHNNNKEAMYYLSECYKRGRGVDANYEKGEEWLRKSAEMGYAPAQHDVALKILRTPNLPDNLKKEPFELLMKSVDQNYPTALWNLGLFYQIGHNVEQDEQKGNELIRRAALLGHSGAIHEMVKVELAQKNNEEAKKWYELGASFNLEWAINGLERYKIKGHF